MPRRNRLNSGHTKRAITALEQSAQGASEGHRRQLEAACIGDEELQIKLVLGDWIDIHAKQHGFTCGGIVCLRRSDSNLLRSARFRRVKMSARFRDMFPSWSQAAIVATNTARHAHTAWKTVLTLL